MTDLFDRLGPPLLVREGGGTYTNRAADAGGPTRWGITAKALGSWRKLGRDATAAEVMALERPEAMAIYRAEYFTDPGWDQVAVLSEPIAAELFDTGVNMGVGTAATFLQRALNVLNRNGSDYPDLVVDGQAGGTTRARLATFLRIRGGPGETVLLKALNCLQGARYIELAEKRSADEQNEFGWLAQRVGLAA